MHSQREAFCSVMLPSSVNFTAHRHQKSSANPLSGVTITFQVNNHITSVSLELSIRDPSSPPPSVDRNLSVETEKARFMGVSTSGKGSHSKGVQINENNSLTDFGLNQVIGYPSPHLAYFPGLSRFSAFN
jgi:hypothetical protein